MPENQPDAQSESKNEGVYAWRFANADGTTSFQQTPQTVGRRYKLPYRAEEERADGGSPKSGRCIRAGAYGYHGSVDPLDALDYGDGFFVERVLLQGHKDINPDKIAASLRTTLWRADAKKTVHLFAASCVERALYKCNASSEEMAKCWIAVEALRHFATGEVSEEEMRACINRMQPPHRELGETNPLKLVARAACYAALSFNAFGDAANACWDAAEAVVYASTQGDVSTPEGKQDDNEAWRAERLWQARSLNLLLLVLAPDGYTEPGWNASIEVPNAEGIAP